MNEADKVLIWAVVLVAVAVVVLVLSIMFWLRFYRMMDDVRRIAMKLDPPPPPPKMTELQRKRSMFD